MTASEKYQAYSVISDFAERERVSRLAACMAEIRDSKTKMLTYATISRREGISMSNLQRLFKAWRDSGENDLVLADRRKMSKPSRGSRFYADFKNFADKDSNTDQGGYDAMMRHFYAGGTFSFGTWRDLYRIEFPGSVVPPDCPAHWVPRGMTYSNFNKYKKRDPSRQMQLAWNRQGQFAALASTLPVVRSRVGLPVGSLFQADDVWHNVDVFAPGQSGTFQPLEFAIYDVASAFKVVSAMKPRILVRDPKTGKEVRDNLKEIQFRFALQYLVCCKGFHKDGATFILERGTTAIRENVQQRIAAVPGWGKLIRFQVSGLLNQPAHDGLLMGNAGGNPRMKSLCECAHNILHNATASLLGNRGRDAAHLHESNNAVVKYSQSMIDLAQRIDPCLVSHLMLPILQYDKYCQYFYMIEDEVMDRTRHNLEGWAGREVMEYRLSETSDWINCERLNDMAPDEVTATMAVVNRDKAHLLRQRKMSRREVWNSGVRELVKWPLFDLPAFADPRDAREATVRGDGTISFTDVVYYPGQRKTYIAECIDRKGLHRLLAPGTKVKFFFNPLGELSDHIWITDEAGENIIGMCPILKTAAWASPDSIRAAMGQKIHQVTNMMEEVKARHAPDTVRRLVAEKFNTFLLESAKEAQRTPDLGAGEALSPSEVLDFDVTTGEPMMPQKAGTKSALDLLNQLV